jgi:hypothetical protein
MLLRRPSAAAARIMRTGAAAMDLPTPAVAPDGSPPTPSGAPPRRIGIDRRTFLQGASATATLLAVASAVAPAACTAASIRGVPVPALRPEPWDDGTFWDDGTGWIP